MSSKQKNELDIALNTFISRLKRQEIEGSYSKAIETLQFLKRYLSIARWSNVSELIDILRDVGNKIEKAHPTSFACGNVIRRILSSLRDEIDEELKDETSNQTNPINPVVAEPMMSGMFNLLQKPVEENVKLQNINKSKTDFRQVIIQAIKDLIDEIMNIDDGIQQIAIDLIHDHEILLTPTPESKTVLKFLIRAKEKSHRKFNVLVTESFPNNTKKAHEFAKKLAQYNIDTTIIPDSAVFALMSRVGKVIIGTKTVFVNGGALMSSSGVSSVCECAHEFKTPVFAVSGLYKLSPLYPFDENKLIEFGSSQKVLPILDTPGRLDTINPINEYVSPENIDIFITNIGGFAPSFIYRVAWDNYKQIDVDLETEA